LKKNDLKNIDLKRKRTKFEKKQKQNQIKEMKFKNNFNKKKV